MSTNTSYDESVIPLYHFSLIKCDNPVLWCTIISSYTHQHLKSHFSMFLDFCDFLMFLDFQFFNVFRFSKISPLKIKIFLEFWFLIKKTKKNWPSGVVHLKVLSEIPDLASVHNKSWNECIHSHEVILTHLLTYHHLVCLKYITLRTSANFSNLMQEAPPSRINFNNRS